MNQIGLDERIAILKSLADATRLHLVNALLEKPHCVEDLAERLRRSPSTISFHLRRLEEAGLVTKSKTQYYLIYELRPDVLAMQMKEFIALPSNAGSPEQKRLDDDRKRIVQTYIRNSRLQKIPKQWKKRRIILEEFMRKFDEGDEYPEEIVNRRIMTLYDDYCTIRRMLVDEGFMIRKDQNYFVLPQGQQSMRTRAEIKREYKQTKPQAGMYQIKNTVNGKVYLGSSTNLHGPLNRNKFLLTSGLHKNERLQKDWNTLGPDAFTFDILEVVKQSDDSNFSLETELTLLEEIWIEKLGHHGDKAYNSPSTIRDA